ncbi:SpdD protein [Streptomyces chengbuensis]|uniref:SpdD protein n=1 Tax=Streptomyces chengbuensis TaxID=3053466 RepID=UPI0025B294CB|nr:SpdD protein [Streptomyces sp. HUAS CB01]WJY52563.1 SpdD protein [Streptomyces sp. HUAS CB01]
MFRPKLPDIPTPPPTVVPQQTQAPAPAGGRSVAPYLGVGAGAVAAVVVVGVVLTALLAAVAVSAVSVAIAAVVLRSLVTGAHKR